MWKNLIIYMAENKRRRGVPAAEQASATTGEVSHNRLRQRRARKATVPSRVRASEPSVPRQRESSDGEQLPIGARIEAWRKRRGYTLAELGDKIGRSHEWVRLFESGKTNTLSPRLIKKLKQAILHMDITGWEGMQLREALEEIEVSRRPTEAQLLTDTEIMWLRTFARPGMTLSRELQYLRLSTGLTQEVFAARAGVHPQSIDEYERLGVTPILLNLEGIMRAAGLDPDGKPAQLLRLQREGLGEKSVEDLQTCTFGELMRYLRVLKGAKTYFGEEIGYSSSTGVISGIELEHFSMREEAVEAFINWLDLAPNSALAKIIRRKHSKGLEPISSHMLDQVLKEPYLFEEHFDISRYPLSDRDDELFSALLDVDSFEEKIILLTRLGTENRDIQAKFWKTREMYTKYVRGLKAGGSKVNANKLVHLLMVYGYDINHPITLHFLETLNPLPIAQE